MIRTAFRLQLSQIVFVALASLMAALLLNGCAAPRQKAQSGQFTPDIHPSRRGPLLTRIVGQPRVRVRLEISTSKAVISASSPIKIGPARRQASSKYFASPVTINRKSGRFVIRAGNGATRSWSAKAIRLAPSLSRTLTFDGAQYPNALVLNALYYKGHDTGHLNVVNYLALESYIPGVISHELYGSWDLAAFEAQAVAARSYAIYEISLHGDKTYDLSSTTASQVYGGTTANTTALKAARQTRGQVLVYNGRVLPAFYSSTSGGRSQDVRLAMPKVFAIPPLSAHKLDSWGKASPKYRWGPMFRHTNVLSKRIAAWGKANDNPVAGLGSIRAIKIRVRSKNGRPGAFTITGGGGRQYVLLCEQFRRACDYRAGGLPDVKALPSSDFDVSVSGNTVRFTNGRGYGHGVGMSQWGAQGMAQAGYGYTAILQYYYPGVRVEKIY